MHKNSKHRLKISPVKAVKSIIDSKLKDSTKTERLLYKETFFAADSSTLVRNRFSTTFLTPFALKMGAPSSFIGLLTSVPLVIGSVFQLFVADIMKVVKRRKEIIFFTSLIESILWIPILLIPFIWKSNYLLLLNIVVLQAISISILKPFYSSMLGDIVPSYKRGKILGLMNTISGGVTFFSNILFGFILMLFEKINPFIGFAVIFGINGTSRIIASFLKSKYRDSNFDVDSRMQSLINFSKNIKKTNFGKFVIFSSMMQFSLSIAGPFFAPYMIEYLGWNLLTYTFVSSASIISSLLVLKSWGKHIDQKGSRWILAISGFIVPFFPIFWIFFKNPVVLLFIQFISGAVWSGYNLSTSSFVMDATTKKTRIILSSYFFFFNGISVFFGSIIGGFFLHYLPQGFFGSSYYFIFGLSAILRFAVSAYFIPKLSEERYVNIRVRGSDNEVFIYPNRGFVEVDPEKRK